MKFGRILCRPERVAGDGGGVRARNLLLLTMIVAMLLAALPLSVMASHGGSGNVSASFTSGGVLLGAARFAKHGDTLTLTVSTPSSTECVKLSGYRTMTQTSNRGSSSWTFTFQAGFEGDGAKSVTATAFNTRSWGKNDCSNSIDRAPASFALDNTAPSLSGTLAPTNLGDDGWYVGDATVVWSCGDAGSGVASCPTGSTVTGEGSALSATASASDHVGNSTTTTVGGIMIDRTAPVTSATPSGGGEWNNENVELVLSTSDNLSGVRVTHYRVNGGAVETYGGPITFTSDGIYAVSYWSVDTAGNAESDRSAVVKIDKTDPTITANQTPAKNIAGWNNSAVTVDFTCGDGSGNVSGVASCGPTPQVVTAEGEHRVEATAVDNARNSALGQHPVNLDTTAPTLDALVDGSSTLEAWYTAVPVTIAFVCDDPVSGGTSSGVAACPGAVQLTAEGGGQSIGPVDILDNADNSSAALTLGGINIDTQAPTTTSDAPSGWQRGPVMVSLSASDATSGVAGTYHTVNGVAGTGTSLSLVDDGVHAVAFWSVDVAGNVEPAQLVLVAIDSSVPALGITDPADGSSTSATSVTVSGTASDAGSGLAGVTVNGQAVAVVGGGFSHTVSLECGTNVITAVADDEVGHSSQAQVRVLRQCATVDQILSPLQASRAGAVQVNEIKRGRVVPVKVTIDAGGSAYTGMDPATPKPTIRVALLSTCTDADGLPNSVTETAGSANSGSEFRWSDEGHWIFNLGTSALEVSKCYRIDVLLDGRQVSTTRWAVMRATR